jgi:hypothetical protein
LTHFILLHWLLIHANFLVHYFRNFSNVIRLVVERAQEIPKIHRILFWRHCLFHIFGYLVQTPL